MPAINPRLILEAYEHPNYGGRAGYFIDPVPSLGAVGFPGGIRSAKVYRGPGWRRGPNYRVILYEKPNMQGQKLVLGPGAYPNLLDMAERHSGRYASIQFGPDYTVSGPVWGTIPVIVELFVDRDFKGRRAVVLRDVPNTHTQLGMPDMISSIRVWKGPDFPPTGAKVRLFEHIDFEGSFLEIEMTAAHQKREIPDLSLFQMVGGRYATTFGDSISSIQIEGWASSDEFRELVFEDLFDEPEMKPVWEWVAPTGGIVWSGRQGYLEMRVQPGRDLWHGNPPGRGGNLDAPRLLMTMYGDFSVETRMAISPQLREHGGILVWDGPMRFLRLEKTSGAHAFRGTVRFERHVNRVFSLVGRGPESLVRVRNLYLRLERRGSEFRGFASADGTHWIPVGVTQVGMRDPVQVGLHALAPGNIPPTTTRFDWFRVYARPGEGMALGLSPKVAGLERPLSETRRLMMLRRFLRS